MTCGHRDGFDCDSCILSPYGRVKSGGELVCEETGLVFRLNPGDIFIFRSRTITHYNLHYVGIRASVVIQTDRYGKSWVSSRNGYWSEIQTGATDADNPLDVS